MATAVPCGIYLNSWAFDAGGQHLLRSSEGLCKMSSAALCLEGGRKGLQHLLWVMCTCTSGFAMVRIECYF